MVVRVDLRNHGVQGPTRALQCVAIFLVYGRGVVVRSDRWEVMLIGVVHDQIAMVMRVC